MHECTADMLCNIYNNLSLSGTDSCFFCANRLSDIMAPVVVHILTPAILLLLPDSFIYKVNLPFAAGTESVSSFFEIHQGKKQNYSKIKVHPYANTPFSVNVVKNVFLYIKRPLIQRAIHPFLFSSNIIKY